MSWIKEIKKHGWKQHSQTGEEGYIEFILLMIEENNKLSNRMCVDIGAGLHISNTRYFIERGYDHISIDGEPTADYIQKEWITKDNIVSILEKNQCPKEFDFLSIDIDGNDYYVLDAILKKYKPLLVVAEFNGTLPKDKALVIEYNENHKWNNDDYYGFSFLAGKELFEKHGYKVVFQNDSLNMYAVREDMIKEEVPEVNYMPMQYHAHNPNGKWVNLHSDGIMQGAGLPFNGDIHMEEEFIRLRDEYKIDTVIETGTYKADTTEWLSDNFKKVISTEIHRDYYSHSVMRMAGKDNTMIIFGDSTKVLKTILPTLSERRMIIFLDSHWYSNPLQGEFIAIRESGVKPILVIHDFQNPDDPTMGFDDYPDQKYNWEAIRPYIEAIYGKEYTYYYNKKATGARRGCIFIIPNGISIPQA